MRCYVCKEPISEQEAEDVLAVIDHLREEPFTTVMESLGLIHISDSTDEERTKDGAVAVHLAHIAECLRSR